MAINAQRQPRTIEQARVELSRRLGVRRSEIEAAVMTRVYAVADPSDLDPAYAEGLRAAVGAAVDYGLAAIELGEERSSPPPPILLAQARLAARAGVSLDTVLRRYFAGHALLGDFLIEEAEGGRLLRGAALQGLLRTQAALFDRLLAAVSEEYGREGGNRPASSEQRRTERVERLLAGELVDTSGLGYELEGNHLGVIASGPEAIEAMRAVAASSGRQIMCVNRGDGPAWGWFGGRDRFDPEEVDRFVACWPEGLSVAIGEPAEGMAGWRLTHQQASAAFRIALCGGVATARYGDVALLAAVLSDDLLAGSLRQLYIAPLQRERDGGAVALETLRAYFAAGGNASSAGVVLGVQRHTVTNRLRAIEECIGRSLRVCSAEIEVALRLAELQDSA